MKYDIYRLKETEDNAPHRFMSSAYLQLTNSWPPKPDAYEKIYEGTVRAFSSTEALEGLLIKFELDHPKGFPIPLMSLGDIVILTETEKPGAHFCDPIGFTEVPEFYAAITSKEESHG